jgi:outer membrane protein assembly factor BamB
LQPRKTRLITTIVFTLMLATATLLVMTPAVTAPTMEFDTFLFVLASPNPVQVNQRVHITYQLDKTSPTAFGLDQGDHFTGFTVTINKPDGTTDTLGPAEAWAMSGAFFSYTPTQVGTYTLQANFPGQWINTTFFGQLGYQSFTDHWFKPSTSSVETLTVQEGPIEGIPDVPLPGVGDVWRRPVNAENKGWYQVADNWLMEAYDYLSRSFPGYTAYAPYTSAPNSAHILWNRELWFGGIGGGPFGDKSFYSGLSYEQPYNPFILQGRIIYSEHDPASGGNLIGTRCLNLYTGEEIWFLPNVDIDFAQVFDIENPNEHGLIAHLWDTSGFGSNVTARVYDGITGVLTYVMTNITWGGSRGTQFGPSGEVLSWRISGPTSNRHITLWNSSKAIFSEFPWIGDPPGGGGIYSPTEARVISGELGLEWDVQIPPLPGSFRGGNIETGVLLTESIDTSTSPLTFIHAGYDMWTGARLWQQNRTDIFVKPFSMTSQSTTAIGRDGVYSIYDQAKLTLHLYDITTGNELWSYGPVSPSGWAYFARCFDLAYGNVYMAGYDGYIRAFSIEDGEPQWEYYYGNSGYETPYESWPTYNGYTIADHKIFATNDDHSPDSVLWRGGKLHAVNADTGEGVWNISGWFRIPAISDGILTSFNSLDGRIYAFGKGPSATTVTVPGTAIQVGESFTITGSVTDKSPGQAGNPAISKEDMAA